MVRIKRGNVARKRRKKILGLTKGCTGSKSKLFRTANQQYLKNLSNAYKSRKLKKRFFRSLWILKINSAIRKENGKYSLLISGLKRAKIGVNRKVLYALSLLYNKVFSLNEMTKRDNFSLVKI